jgi:hypothetical protein
MLLDTIHGIIDRRILLNYQIEPEPLRLGRRDIIMG